MTPNKKAPIDWSDEDADHVLKSVLWVVSPDMRKSAERDIRDLMARAWLLGEATRTVRQEAGRDMVLVPKELLRHAQYKCSDLGVQLAIHNYLAEPSTAAPSVSTEEKK